MPAGDVVGALFVHGLGHAREIEDGDDRHSGVNGLIWALAQILDSDRGASLRCSIAARRSSVRRRAPCVEWRLLTLRQVGAEFLALVWSPVTVQVMQADAPSWETLVFDGIDDVDVVKVTVAFEVVDIVARGHGTGATCPDCGHRSERTHGSYQRRLRDPPLGELRVVILLKVRRFICGAGTRRPALVARSPSRSRG